MMFTLWDSLAAVKAFASDEYESAVFYPEDERFLVERDLTSTHYMRSTPTFGPLIPDQREAVTIIAPGGTLGTPQLANEAEQQYKLGLT
jgi:hypothetical protein